MARIRFDLPGPVIEDFDATLRVYRNRLGRIDFCPHVTVRPGPPPRLADYRAQTGQWFTGLWLAMRRTGAPAGVRVAAVELVLASVLLVLTPVALVLGGLAAAGIGPTWMVGLLVLGVAVLVADYLLTVAVAVATLRPRLLLLGLAFPVLRVVDAALALRALVRARLGRPRAEWLAFAPAADSAPAPGSPAARRAWWLTGPLAVLGWLLVVGAGAAVVYRVARSIATVAPTRVEPALVEFAYSQYIGNVESAAGAGPTMTGLQLRLYTVITRAFDRGSSVLVAAREMSVVTAAVLLLGLVLAAALLRVRSLLIALVLVLLAISAPVSTLLTPVGPGGIAATWLMLGAAAGVAAIGWRAPRWGIAAGIALLAAVTTAPVLIVPLGVGLAAWVLGTGRLGWRRASAGVVLLALTAGLTVLLWRGDAPPIEPAGASALGPGQRLGLLAVAGAVALGGLAAGWLRPAAIGLGVGAGFAYAAGPGADALLPALLLMAALLLAVLAEEATGWLPDSGALLARRAAVALTAVVAIVAAIAGIGLGPRPWTPPDHAGLATWVSDNVDAGVTMVAPASVWPDLQRDLIRAGLADGTVRRESGTSVKPHELLVTIGPDRPSGVRLATFDTPDEEQAVAVLLTRPDVDYLEPTRRANAGRQLAENDRLDTSDEVRAALRDGQVDLRAMALLAGLCREHRVTLTRTLNPKHESGSPMPHRILVLSEVDGRSVADPSSAPAVDWLRAQEPPYAPSDIEVGPDGLTLRWRLPARFESPLEIR